MPLCRLSLLLLSQALSKLFPNADEKTLDRLTKSADKSHYDSSKHKTVFRDGKIDKSGEREQCAVAAIYDLLTSNVIVLIAEFITLYLSMLHQQGGSSNPCNNKNACGFGQTCYVCRSTKGFCCKTIVTGSFLCSGAELMVCIVCFEFRNVSPPSLTKTNVILPC